MSRVRGGVQADGLAKDFIDFADLSHNPRFALIAFI